MGNIQQAIAALARLDKKHVPLIAAYEICCEIGGIDSNGDYCQLRSLDGIKGSDQWRAEQTSGLIMGGQHEPQPGITTTYYRIDEDEPEILEDVNHPRLMRTNTGYLVMLAV